MGSQASTGCSAAGAPVSDGVGMRLLAQRTFEIWSFAFSFFFRLWLSGRKFSYGKEVRCPEGPPALCLTGHRAELQCCCWCCLASLRWSPV